MTPQVRVTDDVGATAGAMVRDALRDAVIAHGHARLAISGGGSPISTFRWLADNLDEAAARTLIVTWVDERHLPLSSDPDWRALPQDSNLRAAWQHWFSRTPHVPNLVPMTRRGTLADAAESFVDDFPGTDVILMGCGPDGHVASLFPDHPANDAPGLVTTVSDSPKPPAERLTLTPRALEDADLVVLVATGASKRDALEHAASGAGTTPLSRLTPRARYLWVVDAAAWPHPPSIRPQKGANHG